jgi:hypothetical protein
MNDTISSVKGYWRGSPRASLTIDGAAGATPLAATTNQNNWGDSIYVKDSEKSNSRRPYVNVSLPSDVDTAGKTGTIKIDLDVEYPEISGNAFYPKSRHMTRELSVKLAPPGAGSTYEGTWWTGVGVGSLIVFGASVAMYFGARAFQAKAKPTKVYPVEQQAEEQPAA